MIRLGIYAFILMSIVIFGVVSCIGNAAASETIQLKLPIIKVIDGDTIQTEITLPAPLNDVRIRIIGIDTPEKPAASFLETGKLGRAQCKREAELALKAKAYVQQLVNESLTYMIITNFQWDKFGGRIDAVVYLINRDTGDILNLGQSLIEKGLAVKYDGGTKINKWCKK